MSIDPRIMRILPTNRIVNFLIIVDSLIQVYHIFLTLSRVIFDFSTEILFLSSTFVLFVRVFYTSLWVNLPSFAEFFISIQHRVRVLLTFTLAHPATSELNQPFNSIR